MIEYRKATWADSAELARLRADFLCEIDGHDRETQHLPLRESNLLYFRSALADGSFAAWLALENGEIIATSGLSLYRVPPNIKTPNGRVGYISNMYTLPAYRGKGVASKIFDLLVAEARERGCHALSLKATEMGRPIYERFGFRASGDHMTYRIE